MLFHFGKSTSPLCSFCKLHDETLIHIFHYNQIISLWIKIKLFFFEYIQLILLFTQIATFILVVDNDKFFLIHNHMAQ